LHTKFTEKTAKNFYAHQFKNGSAQGWIAQPTAVGGGREGMGMGRPDRHTGLDGQINRRTDRHTDTQGKTYTSLLRGL